MLRLIIRRRPRESIWADVPESRALIGLPCPLDTRHGTALAPRWLRYAVVCPSPELRANWDWLSARAHRRESAGRRVPIGF
jgi:hypothetical protein